jgi:hypothetical protein
MAIKIGSRVKDKITGLTGIVIGRTEWLTGCATVGVKPEETKDGKTIDATWLDEISVTVIQEKVFTINMAPAAPDVGGPHDAPSRTVSPG